MILKDLILINGRQKEDISISQDNFDQMLKQVKQL